MRISQEVLNVIKKVVKDNFGDDAEIFIFGSRVDDNKKGGDIDIYVETVLRQDEIIRAKIKSLVEFDKLLGERKIDIIAKSKNSKDNIIHKIAKSSGIKI